jgi:hypothetical protein
MPNESDLQGPVMIMSFCECVKIRCVSFDTAALNHMSPLLIHPIHESRCKDKMLPETPGVSELQGFGKPEGSPEALAVLLGGRPGGGPEMPPSLA